MGWGLIIKNLIYEAIGLSPELAHRFLNDTPKVGWFFSKSVSIKKSFLHFENQIP